MGGRRRSLFSRRFAAEIAHALILLLFFFYVVAVCRLLVLVRKGSLAAVRGAGVAKVLSQR